KWNELTAQWIAIWIRPFDEREQIRRDPHAHRRALEARLGVPVEVGRDQILDSRKELLDVRDRVLGLPLVIEELIFGGLGVGGDLLPERPLPKLLVEKGALVDGRLERARRALSGVAGNCGKCHVAVRHGRTAPAFRWVLII